MFVPCDLHLRIRDKIQKLTQRDCKSVRDYVSKFRSLVLQVEDMTKLDKFVYFLDGLLHETKQEVLYIDLQDLQQAITVAI